MGLELGGYCGAKDQGKRTCKKKWGTCSATHPVGVRRGIGKRAVETEGLTTCRMGAQKTEVKMNGLERGESLVRGRLSTR